MLVSLLAIIPMFPRAYAIQGPEVDVLRHTVISSPDAALIAMQTGIADFSPDQIRTADIEKQDADGMLITQNLGFHMGFIGYNIRADQSYRRTDAEALAFWPLSDVDFRHALVHGYDQLGIIPPIYGYIVTPVRSLVPPAESKYYSPAVPEHPYNPGNPITSPSGEHSSVGILKAAGYTFMDEGTSGVVDDADYWKAPGGSALPSMTIYTPLIGIAPTSFQHGQEFVADLAAIGLAATTSNGNHGMISLGYDFNGYLALVYDHADFDAYMVFYSLGRIPSQLYSLLHTSQDTLNFPGRRNGVGVNDPTIDAYCETVKFSLDTNAIETAAKAVQTMLYTPTLAGADNFALSYMTLYSRSYFNAFVEDLEGIVKSPGYGSDNGWTSLVMHWAANPRQEDGKNVVVYINGDEPASFNPMYATTVYEWNIIGSALDGLTAVNPFNHNDVPWIATDWTITELTNQGPYSNETWMDIDFTLRDDVYWQDGILMDAYDVEFNLEFLRDFNVPRYAETWETLIDVSVTDATHLTVSADMAGIDLFYDYSGLALYLPPQIWDRTWATDQAVLDYDPIAYVYGDDMAPGYSKGPNDLPSNLFGTGPWIFQFYDSVNFYDDMWANRNYFMDQTDVDALMTQMFWEVGDHGKDGAITVLDLTFVSFSFGYMYPYDPEYDPDADFNSDDIVDMRDMRTSAFHLLWEKEL